MSHQPRRSLTASQHACHDRTSNSGQRIDMLRPLAGSPSSRPCASPPAIAGESPFLAHDGGLLLHPAEAEPDTVGELRTV